MPRTLSKAIQGTFKQPVFIFVCIWITNGWFDYRDFVTGKNALTKGILAVSLLQDYPLLNSHADDQT
jgi:hypothetical protein